MASCEGKAIAEAKQTGGQTMGFPLPSELFGHAAQLLAPSAIPCIPAIFTDMMLA
ncbi:hypothetical protein [Mesorhizobium sp. M7A.F.Ca.US.008.03.1.1]|uniref:hypothetical protein n=1 Tax=Mesorhizobium sp. M7A.F.Ca.US.008.03.1.1 TaxID=2496742 RepID=UPI0013E0A6A7|nr:hypothetical protein [Mesorhizobium sp. M7A.F.Ca.US.008.03.1.1]